MKTNLYVRFSFVLILFLGSIASLAGLAASGDWWGPGDLGYPLQRAGEQVMAFLEPDDASRVDWLVALVVRRCDRLTGQAGAPDQDQLLREIERDLDRAAAAYARLPEGGLQKEALRNAAAQCEIALELNRPEAYPRLGFLESKLHSLRLVLNSPSARPADTLDIIALLLKTPTAGTPHPIGTESALVDPRIVTFPTNSAGALHVFYPLTGRHAGLGCNECHPAGNYAGTPNLCLDCHLGEEPADHYGLECSACHTPDGWEFYNFDHRVVADRACATCHQQDAPAAHYPGPCSACHTPTDWRQVTFDHRTAGATDCAACHSDARPANHYTGQCSLCHSTTAWLPATFNHAAVGATDCISCHTDRKPANHYTGQCSLCHSTTAWRPATFNHAAMGATDCISCHTNRKPANHYTGQCSLCHSTTAWLPATFNHAAMGATDCIGCHLSKKPANHYDGQCSTCHSTTTWKNASYPHTFPTNHRGANNQCAKCHPVSIQQWTCYVCHNQAEMESKHLEKNITNITTRCLECHPTGVNP